MHYVKIVDSELEDAEVIEVPIAGDGTLLVATVAALYPGVSCLKYRLDGRTRAVKVADGKLYSPEGGWGEFIYICVFPKVRTNTEKEPTTVLAASGDDNLIKEIRKMTKKINKMSEQNSEMSARNSEMSKKIDELAKNIDEMRSDLDLMKINNGLVVIGEASNKIMGAYGHKKGSKRTSHLRKKQPNQQLTTPEIDDDFFTLDEFNKCKKPGPTQKKFDKFLDNAYEVKCTYSHEGQSIDAKDLKRIYDDTIVLMKRSPDLEIPNKRVKLFKKSNKSFPS